VFVQIGQENLHFVRAVLDEVMGRQNLQAQIEFRKKMMPLSKKPGCESMVDYILWYVRDKASAAKTINKLFVDQIVEGDSSWNKVEIPSGELRWTPLVGRVIGLNKLVGLAARRTPYRSCAAAAAVELSDVLTSYQLVARDFNSFFVWRQRAA
jgi:hypothetical protein